MRESGSGRKAALASVSWGDDPRLVEVLGEQGACEFRALYDSFPEAVGVLWALRGADGQIEDFAFGYGNPAIMRSFRMPSATPERYTLLEALPRMRSNAAFAAYVDVCETGRPWVSEITYDTPFGDGYMVGTFVLRVAKLGDGLVVFLTDVTAKRRMEAELRDYADLVAHDLREPISAMNMLVSVLERSEGEPPPPDVIQLLRASTERARELIDAVLEYARLGELNAEPVALGCLMEDVAEDLRPKLDASEAELEVAELPEVECDPNQIRRVLQNLVGNALKFASATRPHVRVSAEHGSREFVLTVRDNGMGVDPADAQRIFGVFARADHEHDGLGIGLAVCRRVVEAHGGSIWVEPAEDGGSAFRFTLPR